MKPYLTVVILGLLAVGMRVDTPSAIEKHYPLSKKAKKGYVYEVTSDASNIKVTYKVKGDSKDEVAYQVYEFDKGLNLLSADPKRVKIDNAAKEDYTKNSLAAYVGGSTSFSVLSMSIKFYKRERKFTWDDDKKRFDVKTVKSEEVKLKNDEGKKYVGYADYYNIDNQNVLALAKVADKFSLLNVNYDLDIKETPIPFDYPVALVYTAKISDASSGNGLEYYEMASKDKIIFIFAPNVKKGVDPKNYTLVVTDREGMILSRNDFMAPSANMAVMDAAQKGNDIYLCAGSSDNADDLYLPVYGEYTTIYNAGGGDNAKQLTYHKKARDYKSFHIVKITDGKVSFIATSDLKEFKSKLRTPSGQKSKVSSYEGGRLAIAASFVAPNGDFFVSGQKVDVETKGTMYEDIVCFQFDKTGKLKAQYGIDNLNDDNKSTIFSVKQNFVGSPGDPDNVYLELLEVKGVTGYAGFMDAYNGRKTFYAKFYPRIIKVKTSAAAITSVDVLGSGKYFLNNNSSSIFRETGKATVYVGENLDDDEIWLGSYQFE